MGRLDNKKIVVCGGSTGIGHAVSVLAAKEGALVLNLDLQEADHFKTYNCNLTDISSARDAVGSLLSDYGHVDGMVNAVRLRDRRIGDTLESMTNRIIDEVRVCLGPLDPLAESMASKEGGSIVHISSILGQLISVENELSYHCGKAMMEQVTRYYACLYGRSGVRVNAVKPGLISRGSREIASNHEGTSLYQRLATRIPSPATASPDDVAHVVVFLLSDNSFFLNGETITIDGGQSIQELTSVLNEG